MPETTDNSLPSVFDLIFDIKRKTDLIEHYKRIKHEVESIEELAQDYGIDLE